MENRDKFLKEEKSIVGSFNGWVLEFQSSSCFGLEPRIAVMSAERVQQSLIIRRDTTGQQASGPRALTRTDSYIRHHSIR